MANWSAERQDTADRLIEALERDRFVLHSQEIRALKRTDEVPYREILIRFLDEEETLLPPGTFIPLLEGYTLMYTLDRWVITRVLSWLHKASGRGSKRYPARCSINLSAETVRNHEFPTFLVEQLKLFKVAPGSILFEVTEADAAAHPAALGKAVKRLKNAGCGVALTAYNGDLISYEALKQLAVDIVKIDGDIIRHIHASESHLKTAVAINRICHAFGMRTVGELVERVETLDQLEQAGVDYAQGFAVALPEVLT